MIERNARASLANGGNAKDCGQFSQGRITPCDAPPMTRDTVLQASSNHLRLHIEEHAALSFPLDLPAWSAIQTALSGLTGWQLECDRGPAPRGAELLGALADDPQRTPRQFYLQRNTASRDATSGDSSPRTGNAAISGLSRDLLALQLAKSLVELLNELHRTRRALRNREAELATAVPVIARPEENAEFSFRLESVLRGAVEGLHGRGAALYLLDDATTELKLRSHFGLDGQRFLEPPRPLAQSLADLEALTGHAVVLDDAALMKRWNVPEKCGSAVCVPVSSPDTLLGTLWFYSDECRSFTDEETQLLEIIAGRLAAELECQVLAKEISSVSNRRDQTQRLEEWHDERLKLAPPICDGWQVAGASIPSAQPRGDFHTWRLDPSSHLWVASAASPGTAVESLLTSASLRGALQTSLLQPTLPARVLQDLNEILWSDSPGHDGAAAFCGCIHPKTGQLRYAAAGPSDAYILRPHGWEPIVADHPALGIQPDWLVTDDVLAIHPGDVLLVVSHRDVAKTEGNRPLSATWLAENLLRYMHLRADELAEMACSILSRQGTGLWARSLMVIKRNEPRR